MKDELLELGLPANLLAEQLCLGSVISTGGNDFGLLRGALEADDFSLEKHRRIFLRMGELFERGETIDTVSLANELTKQDQLSSVDGVGYLAELMRLPEVVNVDGWIRIVQDKAILRRAALLSRSLMLQFVRAADLPGELIEQAKAFFGELGTKVFSEDLLQIAERVLAGLDINSIGKVPAGAIRTPYPTLNALIVGMQPGELYVVGARPSSGKSIMALETALGASERGSATAFFSLEMSKQALITRAAANRGQVDNTAIRHGRMTEVQRHDFMRAINALRGLPLYLADKVHSLPAMVKEIHAMRDKPKLVIIDHLHLMKSVGHKETRNLELAGITRDLKLLAGEMKFSILLLAQLNRSSPKENREPGMHDLRDCGSIEADADVVVLLHRKEEMEVGIDDRVPPRVDMMLVKNREGMAHRKIPMMLQGKFYRLLELDERESQYDA